MFKNLTKIGWGVIKRGVAKECGEGASKKGIVIGVYDGCNPGEYRYTEAAEKLDKATGGKLTELLKGTCIKKGNAQVLVNLTNEYFGVAVAGLGKDSLGYNSAETLDECKENIRIAAGVGARALQDMGVNAIWVEGFTNAEAAAEGAALGVWMYQEYKNIDNQKSNVKLELYESSDRDRWMQGITKANAQNIARTLEETPANIMTPSQFSQRAIEILCPCGVQVEVRDKNWIESRKLDALLAVSKGSCQPPIFLELAYCAGRPEDKPIVMTGKGITFDSGGLHLRACEGMDKFRGDLAGAAVLIGVFKAIASMSLPLNIKGLIPLCESVIGASSIKTGDVILSQSGKTIRVDDTMNEGRVILSDALYYSSTYFPALLLNVATLCNEAKETLGSGSTPVFCTSNDIWRELNRAGSDSGDRVWRFPFWNVYRENLTSFLEVDVDNVGKGDGGNLAKSAAFLREFIPKELDFVHFDITGTGMLSSGIGFPYLRKGQMTGRPVRTIVQFLYQLACPHTKGDEC